MARDFVLDNLPLPAAKLDYGPGYSADVSRTVMPYDYNALKAAAESLRTYVQALQPGTVQPATFDQLGIAVGATPPSDGVTYAQWQATGTGHFAYLDLSSLVGASLNITPAAASMLLQASPPTVVRDLILQASSAAMQMGAGVPLVTLGGSTSIAPAAASMLMAAGVPVVTTGSGSISITPTVASMLMAAAAPTVSVGAGGGGTVLGFEDGTAQGMTLAAVSVSNVSPIAGSYSLRWAGNITGSALIPGTTGNNVASKSVTITNGATVSFKCRANFSGGFSTCGFSLNVDGAGRANSPTINPGDGTTYTVSWASTLATGAHTIAIFASPNGGNDGEGDVTDSFVLQVDDVTFS